MKIRIIIFQAISILGLCCYGNTSDADFGGIITVWPKEPGLFVFVNNQHAVKETILNKPVEMLKADFNINIKSLSSEGKKFDLKNIPAELKSFGAKGGIYFINDPAFPVVLAAAEDGWGVLNMAPIVADAPDSIKLNKRVQKLINRLFANIHGVADPSMMPACVMKHAVGLAGVDSLICSTFSPEANSKITAYLNKAGYKQRKCGTYYDACEEGWAPTPTNAVQKKIWDKVHKLPTKPLMIVPESQRKKNN
jgi:hypothetical protein